MDNNFKTLLGTELPVIQAPMAGVQNSALAIAVSNAGGLGSLPCGMLSTEQIISELELMRANTNKPYNLNFFCHTVQPFDELKQKQWQTRLRPFFSELDSEFDESKKGSSRVPFSHEVADAIEAFAPPFISFHFGLPEPSLLKRVKAWGAKVVSSATTVEEALWLDENGVDGIIAQGNEGGGHRGMFLTNDITSQLSMACLVSQIVDKVSVPVIAAGGIVDRNTVKSAFALGASAVQVGTAYLLCKEALTSDLHRTAIKSSRASHTALTNVFSGKPARGIVNRAMIELGYMSELAPSFPYASIEMAQLRSLAEQRGLDDFSPLWCGQNTRGCKEVSAAELTLSLVN